MIENRIDLRVEPATATGQQRPASLDLIRGTAIVRRVHALASGRVVLPTGGVADMAAGMRDAGIADDRMETAAIRAGARRRRILCDAAPLRSSSVAVRSIWEEGSCGKCSN